MRAAQYILLFSILTACSQSPEKAPNENTIIGIDIAKNKGKVIDGKKQGKWTTYFINEQIESISYWKDNKLVGKALHWWPNGKLKSEFCFVDGLQDSVMRTFYMNGNLEEKSYWKNDSANGPAKTYYENGKVEIEGRWKMGKEDGIWTYYDKFGKVLNSRVYDDGKLLNVLKR